MFKLYARNVPSRGDDDVSCARVASAAQTVK